MPGDGRGDASANDRAATAAGQPGSAEAEAEALEYGRWLFAQECLFVLGGASLTQLPAADLPEVAFAGRSNVGKSSLVNALTGRKTLARTSHTPGRTQELNFFLLGQRLYLVDLPGYGYAKVTKAKSSVWTRLVKDYLRGRPNLRRVCLLIDGRHGFKATDEEIMTMLDEAAVPFQIVVTKADKVKAPEMAERLRAMTRALAAHVAAHPQIVVTSAHDGIGIAELRSQIAALTATA